MRYRGSACLHFCIQPLPQCYQRRSPWPPRMLHEALQMCSMGSKLALRRPFEGIADMPCRLQLGRRTLEARASAWGRPGVDPLRSVLFHAPLIAYMVPALALASTGNAHHLCPYGHTRAEGTPYRSAELCTRSCRPLQRVLQHFYCAGALSQGTAAGSPLRHDRQRVGVCACAKPDIAAPELWVDRTGWSRAVEPGAGHGLAHPRPGHGGEQHQQHACPLHAARLTWYRLWSHTFTADSLAALLPRSWSLNQGCTEPCGLASHRRSPVRLKGLRNGMMMQVCTTLGMLTPEQAKQLREAGLTAYNHNLDTSPEYYSKITSSRKYEVGMVPFPCGE